MQKFKNGEIELPVLPKIVQEIQSVIKDPVSTADNLVRVIERDAAISIRLISIANSPIYRGAFFVISCLKKNHPQSYNVTKCGLRGSWAENLQFYATIRLLFRRLYAIISAQLK